MEKTLDELLEYARDNNLIEYGNYVTLRNELDSLYECEGKVSYLEERVEELDIENENLKYENDDLRCQVCELVADANDL